MQTSLGDRRRQELHERETQIARIAAAATNAALPPTLFLENLGTPTSQGDQWVLER